ARRRRPALKWPRCGRSFSRKRRTRSEILRAAELAAGTDLAGCAATAAPGAARAAFDERDQLRPGHRRADADDTASASAAAATGAAARAASAHAAADADGAGPGDLPGGRVDPEGAARAGAAGAGGRVRA